MVQVARIAWMAGEGEKLTETSLCAFQLKCRQCLTGR